MTYVGIQTQIRRNNFNSVLLILAFPIVLLGMVYAILYFSQRQQEVQIVNDTFVRVVPFVILGTTIWFLVAWMIHNSLIRMATGSKPLERIENKRVYNLVENLCISKGMRVPQIYVIEDDSLNAFASGINQRTFSVTLSRGIIDKLEDDELEGVIAHELSHIRNRDVRLMIVSIIFVGIFAFVAEMAFRSIRFGALSRGKKDTGVAILVVIVVSAICYLIALLLRFGISRSREYMADAGAAEMTRKPYALASALRKISSDPLIEAVENRDVAQLFIENPQPEEKKFSFSNLFSTHPPIQKRIELLDQFA
ncbi:MAG: M48 family metallopeptidase [Prolixibacteraceae bacterium]|nr:M48 family metallopeptidase [Prolixibacteraceae bacterium]